MNIFKSCKKTITYLVILSMVVAGVVPTSFVKAEEENTSGNTTEDSLIYKNIKGQCGPQTYFQLEKDGTLRITGTGEIDIEQFDDLQKAEISDKVLKVVMDNEITNIPDGMFKNYKNIKEVELPNGLEIIGKNAFANCKSLKEIVLLRHISKVSDYAFFNCTGLESVYIFLSSNANPNGSYDKIPCGTIEENAFYGCNNMKDVTTGYAVNFPKSWPDSVEKMRLNYGLTGYAEEHGITIIRFSYEGYNTWPDGGKNVVGYTDGFYFIGNKGVIIKKTMLPDLGCKTVIIGNGVEGIEASGMSYKRELEYVYLPESIEYIENYAFQYDAKLKEITIPSKVPEIKDQTFDNCPELTTMTIKNPNIKLAKKSMPINLKTIYGFKGSTAENYAKENGIDFISIDLDYENNDGETSDSTTTETGNNVTTETTNNTSTESGESETSETEENTPVGPTATTPNSTSDINPTEDAENQTTTDITATDKNTEDTGNQPTPEITTTGKNTENTGSQETTDSTTTSKNTEGTGGQTTSGSTTTGKKPENTGSQETPEITTTDKNVEPTESQTTPVVTTTDKNAESQTTSISATTGKKPGNQTTSGRNNTETTKRPFDITPSGKFRIKSVKELNYHSVKLSWKKIKNGNSYKIYKAQKDGQFKLIGKTKSNIFIDSKVKPGKTYFYTIQATGKNNKVTWSVIWSTYVRGVPKKPKLTLRKSKTIWILSWGVIKDNSKGVEVYMKKGTHGKFKKVQIIKNIKKSKKKKGATGMTADVSRLKSKGTYFFKIRTYAIVNGRKIHSRWSKTRKVKK